MMRWYEVWADESLWPPYVLVVVCDGPEFRVVDPKEGDRIVFQAPIYDDVRMWLLEDEFQSVTGRMEFAD